MRGQDGNIRLGGEISIDEARIEANPPGSNGIVRMDVVEINRPGGDMPEEQQTRSRGPQIGMDIAIRSPGGDVRVVGRGLNVEMGVNARVTGTISQPVLTGTARVVRGDYDFAGKRFVFDQTGTVTLSTRPEQIRLNLSATREDPALTATIRVTGTAAAARDRPDLHPRPAAGRNPCRRCCSAARPRSCPPSRRPSWRRAWPRWRAAAALM